MRKTDIIGRYGGEEFTIILPETDITQAFKIMEDLRSAFAGLRLQQQHAELRATLSGGIANFPRFVEASTLNEAADPALYQAKQQGRDQIVLA